MREKGWKLLGVTSATPEAGKSFLAANLAVAMAQLPDVRVVLFDLDFPWVVKEQSLRSRSRNSAFEGARMQGAVIQSFVAGKSVFRHAALSGDYSA